jgi:hypothetical protein
MDTSHCQGFAVTRNGREVPLMNRVFRVEIDLSLLRSHLSREDGCDVSVVEVRQFLLDSGFERQGVGWVVRERQLGAVNPSEVTMAEVVDESPPDFTGGTSDD